MFADYLICKKLLRFRPFNLIRYTLGTLTFDYGENAYTVNESKVMYLTEFDITSNFNGAGKRLGEGLHMEYWVKHSTRNPIDVKIEIIVLANDIDAMQRLNAFADEQFIAMYEANKKAIAKLSEARKVVYEKLINTSDRPIPIPWLLPDSIDFSVSDDSKALGKHLYCMEDGSFKTSLSPWEQGVIEEELRKGAIAWLRNLDRKKWSLEIPYQSNGVTTSMFPDLVVVRKGKHGYEFDILEPHNPSLKDNCDKARGLAQFADAHWDSKFEKIQLIRQQRGPDGHDHFYRLDMSKVDVRDKVRGISSNDELDKIFSVYAVVEE